MHPSEPHPSARTDVAVLLGLLALAVAVYGQVAGFSFVGMDDSQYLADNPWVRGGLSWEGVRWALTDTRTMYWHPATWLSFMTEVQIFGINPTSAHLVNLALHTVNAFLVYRIARFLLGAWGPAALVAAFFCVHPLQAESVAWVAERKTLLCGLFAFLAVLAYIEAYASRPTPIRYLGVAALLALAMAAKPAAAPLPAVLLALDLWPLGRTGNRRTAWLVAEKLPLLLLGILLSRIALAGMEDAGVRISGGFVSWTRRWAEAGAAVGAFFGRAFVPVRLSFWYPPPENLPVAAWSGALLGTGLLALAWGSRRAKPSVTVGILWYLLFLAPGLGLERGGVWPFAADRFQYLALPGLWVAVTEACRAGLSSRPARWLCVSAALGTLAGTTWSQTAHWRDGPTLFRYALEVEPRKNIQALNELGIVLAREGRLHEAAALFRRALARSPCYLKARNNLALAWAELGRLDKAIKEADALLRCRPDDVEGLRLKSRLLAELGRLDEAAATCIRALEMDPDDPDLLAELGRIRLLQGHGEQAVRLLERAVQKGPTDRGAALRDLGAALLLTNRNARAERALRKALAASPTDPDLLANLGLSVARQGRCEEAEGYLIRALALEPGHPAARASLRRIRAGGGCTHPNGP